jgi:hypothetical protein
MTGDNEGFAIDYYLNEREQCNYATGGVRAVVQPAQDSRHEHRLLDTLLLDT